MEKAILLGIVFGCLLGVARFILDDKWNLLPNNLCRFCASSWAAFGLSILIMYADATREIINSTHFLHCGITTIITITIASFSYINIKSAN